MGSTLGIDLGTNSIGWALVDEEKHHIIATGVKVFPMGVNMVKGTKEESKNETRRIKRQVRRQLFRRKLRKEKLVKCLIKNKMFPDIMAAYQRITGMPASGKTFREVWNTVITQQALDTEIRAFFAMDPYRLRERATESALTPHELGRVLYHLSQRRGFKSSMKDDGADEGKIFEGKAEEGKTGILETRAGAREHGTLGKYLAQLDPHETRIRNRYTERRMYEQEFDAIWEAQEKYHSGVLTPELRRELGHRDPNNPLNNGILFYYRPLRIQKFLIGKCEYEPKKRVAHKSSLDFQEFRAWQSINNIRIAGESLSPEQRKMVLQVFRKEKRPFPFQKIAKALKADPNLCNYKPDDKLPGCSTYAQLRGILGKKIEQCDPAYLEHLWHLKYWADDPEAVETILMSEKYGFDEAMAARFIKNKTFKLEDGYASVSRKAIGRILPFLKQGFPYHVAAILGGINNALGTDTWEQLDEETREGLYNLVGEITTTATGEPQTDRLKKALAEDFGFSPKMLNKLYHHSTRVLGDGSRNRLPEPENVRNPIVQKALFELRKLYNAIADEYGKPDCIKVELARELKSSKKDRDKMRKQQQDREAYNMQLRHELEKLNVPANRENIQKLYLFKELEGKAGTAQNPFKPDETIGIHELFSSDIQIEHIIPRSISLNNSLGNKTLCDAATNNLKGNRTPYQFFMETGGDWETIKQRAFHVLPYTKAKRFVAEENPDADDFITRQMNDTRYISKLAARYLREVCTDVQVLPGQLTGLLRHHWGLNGILNRTYPLPAVPNGHYFVAIDENEEPVTWETWDFKTQAKQREKLAKKGKLLEGDVFNEVFYPRKDRQDHRHHAIDALAVALSKRSYLQQYATYLSHEEGTAADYTYQDEHAIERPWKNFFTDARQSILSILVKHSAGNRVVTHTSKRLYDRFGNPRFTGDGKPMYSRGLAARGELHKETVYGRRENNRGETGYHVRKGIESITDHKKWGKIVDARVRKAIIRRLEQIGMDVSGSWSLSDLPAEVRKHAYATLGEDGRLQYHVFIKDKKGRTYPVKKVRIRENLGNARKLKDGINQWVNPRNNHHVLIYMDAQGELQEEVVTFWEAVRRARSGEPIYKQPGGALEKVAVLEENRPFLIGLEGKPIAQLDQEEKSHHLYRVQKVSKGYYVFRKHEATHLGDPTQEKRIVSFKAWQEQKPLGISLNEMGEIL